MFRAKHVQFNFICLNGLEDIQNIWIIRGFWHAVYIAIWSQERHLVNLNKNFPALDFGAFYKFKYDLVALFTVVSKLVFNIFI